MGCKIMNNKRIGLWENRICFQGNVNDQRRITYHENTCYVCNSTKVCKVQRRMKQEVVFWFLGIKSQVEANIPEQKSIFLTGLLFAF